MDGKVRGMKPFACVRELKFTSRRPTSQNKYAYPIEKYTTTIEIINGVKETKILQINPKQTKFSWCYKPKSNKHINQKQNSKNINCKQLINVSILPFILPFAL